MASGLAATVGHVRGGARRCVVGTLSEVPVLVGPSNGALWLQRG